jgi:hypothetical protein
VAQAVNSYLDPVVSRFFEAPKRSPRFVRNAPCASNYLISPLSPAEQALPGSGLLMQVQPSPSKEETNVTI